MQSAESESLVRIAVSVLGIVPSRAVGSKHFGVCPQIFEDRSGALVVALDRARAVAEGDLSAYMQHLVRGPFARRRCPWFLSIALSSSTADITRQVPPPSTKFFEAYIFSVSVLASSPPQPACKPLRAHKNCNHKRTFAQPFLSLLLSWTHCFWQRRRFVVVACAVHRPAVRLYLVHCCCCPGSGPWLVFGPMLVHMTFVRAGDAPLACFRIQAYQRWHTGARERATSLGCYFCSRLPNPLPAHAFQTPHLFMLFPTLSAHALINRNKLTHQQSAVFG